MGSGLGVKKLFLFFCERHNCMKTNIKTYFDKKELLGGLLGAPYEIIPLNSFLLTYLHQNQFVFCFQK